MSSQYDRRQPSILINRSESVKNYGQNKEITSLDELLVFIDDLEK